MPDYSLTKIYKITSPQTDKIYIGSTCQRYLCARMKGHRHDYKHPETRGRCESIHIMKYEDAKIRLIENYPCSSKDEQLMREQFFIDTMDCVNKHASYCTQEDHKKKAKEWYKNNPEKVKAQYEKKMSKKFTCPMCNCTFGNSHRVRHISQCFTKSLDGLNTIMLEEQKMLSPTEIRTHTILRKKLYHAWNKSMDGLNKISLD